MQMLSRLLIAVLSVLEIGISIQHGAITYSWSGGTAGEYAFVDTSSINPIVKKAVVTVSATLNTSTSPIAYASTTQVTSAVYLALPPLLGASVATCAITGNDNSTNAEPVSTTNYPTKITITFTMGGESVDVSGIKSGTVEITPAPPETLVLSASTVTVSKGVTIKILASATGAAAIGDKSHPINIIVK
jgi:hypothetical protein